ncbi:hypothetical protein Aab01nite_44210 [Paractinoplanes abujensis]|uniref:Uncharacterized protein n=1 Tax=Paractinoplanes abujensis TaxID=882441 RepID=A0A7W7CK89_9ACTN|nr:hypothetical protein [Actinoplanes abujensis]MBB4690058.1 hypothetical protein [Actinoplanes abujensis]GID20831.1 hypothetical protein Aab01nite_44210 [Actinoplanes abujensis]
MPLIIVNVFLLGAALLFLLGLLARRQHARAAEPGPVVTEPLEDLAAEVEAVGTAAQQAQRAADAARNRADSAERARDEAEYQYREAQYGPRPDGEEPWRLVERAALEAYRRGDLSAAQLDAIWRHVPGTGLDGRENAVQSARELYESASAEAVRVRQQAYVADVAAEVLAEEQRVAVGQLTVARQSVSGGLPGLFAA